MFIVRGDIVWLYFPFSYIVAMLFTFSLRFTAAQLSWSERERAGMFYCPGISGIVYVVCLCCLAISNEIF